MNNLTSILPLGSLVVIKGATEPLMIVKNDGAVNDKKQYQYVGVSHKLGYINQGLIRCFNNDEIKKIYFIGYVDAKISKRLRQLEALANKRKGDINV